MTDKPTVPAFRNFFRINGLPYEFDKDEVLDIVHELLVNHGATEIYVQRVILDANAPAPDPSALNEPVHIEETAS